MTPRILRFLILCIGLLLTAHSSAAQERVAILGDSITYSGRWATLVESALRNSQRFADGEIVNFGLGSETVSGLSEDGHAGGKFPRPCLHERLARILDAYKPNLVLACYGMNDGIYLPLDPIRAKAFQDGILMLKESTEKAGARIVFITPPPHKADTPSQDPQRYDAVLDAYGEWLVSSRAKGWSVIDIRPDLIQAIAASKRANPAFVYANDGVHPGSDGHGFIATSICRQLWPILKLPGTPRYAEAEALAVLSKRGELLKHAWLTRTRHIRPGIPTGLPLDQANAQAANLMEEYRKTSNSTVSVWHGYEKLDFMTDGRAALLVRPKSPAAGKPWIWRTEFFGHEPQADLALLQEGFHVAYIDMQNLYGAPVAMAAMDGFHALLTKNHGLSDKTILEGFSRGGLFAFNWASRRPDKVAGLYVDAPVCDFKSWPGGKGAGPGAQEDWKRLLGVYSFTEEQALAYPGNPVDNLAPLAKAGIPILAVIGDADEAVPVSENIDLVEKRYLALGGKIKVIRKPGGKHHPHSLPDPKPIVDFALRAYQ